MKKTISIIISLVLTLTCLLTLSGCNNHGNETDNAHLTDDPLALSIVMGIHSKFPKLTFTSDNIQNSLYNACYSYGKVSTVTVEGTPALRGNFEITKPDKSITDTKRKQLARQNMNSIIYDCSLAAATTEETDTLAAIQLSANSLQSSTCSEKQMLVYDSGLCTSGLLNQTSNDVLSADPVLVAEKLAAIHALPDLEGIKVKWVGLACVAGDQDEIPDSYKYKIEQLWSEIIKASGGTVEFDPMPISGDEADGLPNVSTVSFVKDSLDIDFSVSEVMTSPIKFDEETIKFNPDSANFANSKAAYEALTPIAELLKNTPDFNIVIAGTTASAGDGYALSMKRAQACKDVLVSMGADEKQIKCIGLGSSENCFHVDDLDVNGRLIEEYAKLNRAIYVFSATSDIAAQFDVI